eukprot:UN00578
MVEMFARFVVNLLKQNHTNYDQRIKYALCEAGITEALNIALANIYHTRISTITNDM